MAALLMVVEPDVLVVDVPATAVLLTTVVLWPGAGVEVGA